MTATALLLLVPFSTLTENRSDAIIEGRSVSAWVADLADSDSKKQQTAFETLTATVTSTRRCTHSSGCCWEFPTISTGVRRTHRFEGGRCGSPQR